MSKTRRFETPAEWPEKAIPVSKQSQKKTKRQARWERKVIRWNEKCNEKDGIRRESDDSSGDDEGYPY